MTIFKRILFQAFAFTLFLTSHSFGQVRLPAVIGDHMVLQASSNVSLWGWASPAEQVTITTSWDNKTFKTIASNNAKWKIDFDTPDTGGGSYTITIQASNTIVIKDVLLGEVWVCSGQSNMEWSYNAGLKQMKDEFSTCNSYPLRFFNVPKSTSAQPQEKGEGQWVVCDSTTLKSFSAVGYYFGKKISGELKTPVGLINASWSGSPAEVWTPEPVVKNDTAFANAAKKLNVTEWWPTEPGFTYNSMIAPFTPYTIAGVIWYQGESNATTYYTYEPLLISMIDSWRTSWKNLFPFYYVQIAPYQYGTDNQHGALLREVQTNVLKHRNVGMVVITDLVDDVNEIHPANKKDVGIRLANLALSDTYHVKGIASRSPIMKNMTKEKNKIIIDFVNAEGGIIIKGKKATEVYVAGESKIFYPADVIIKDNKLIVSSKQVKDPVAVRYGFSNTAIGNLFSKDGLPVAPFRTDHWNVLTVLKK